ncbi:MAG: hypothetical protein H7296_15150 [Bacteroidia bacterium]|nr:hypothetical protein [Bacteroidia bacterium]
MTTNHTGVNYTKMQNEDTKNQFNIYRNGGINNTLIFEITKLPVVHNLIISGEYKARTAAVRAARRDKIKGEKKSPYDIAKAKLDYACFMAVFKEIEIVVKGELKKTARHEAAIKYLSEYFIIDIDHLTPEQLKALIEKLKQDAKLGVQLMFISPGGDGLKIVVKIDPGLVDLNLSSSKMGNYWAAFNQYFAKHYADFITPSSKGEFIDGACKDVSRACFLCHYPEAYLYENDTVHGQSFLDEYKPLTVVEDFQKNLPAITERIKKKGSKLDEYAKKHLSEADNRTGELLSFINAAKAIGTPPATTKDYIVNNVHIASNSSKNSPEAIGELVNDQYGRYPTDEGQYLTAESFACGLLTFSKTKSGYVAKGIFMEGFINLLYAHGFYRRKVNGIYIFIRKEGRMITQVTPKEILTFISIYIDTLTAGYNVAYDGSAIEVPFITIKQIYINNTTSIFNDSFLQILKVDSQPILKDTRYCSYFIFQNCMVTVTENGIETKDLKGLKADFCYWNTQMLKRNFTYNAEFQKCHWYRFMQNVCNHNSERFLSMITGIGYALHATFNPLLIPALIFVDEAITEKNEANGGSGKGMFLEALQQLRSTVIIDGKGLNPDNPFFLSVVNVDTTIAAIDDLKAGFPSSRLYSMSSNGMTVEKKNKDKWKFEKEDSPKIVITSNQMLKDSGKSDIRRSFYIELSDHYSSPDRKVNLVFNEHKCWFFTDEWGADEWDMFFSTMLYCSVQYLKQGLKHFEGVNIERNRLLQNTSRDFVEWMDAQNIPLDEWQTTKDLYASFTSLYYKEGRGIEQATFSKWVKSYAAVAGLDYERKDGGGKPLFILSKHIK